MSSDVNVYAVLLALDQDNREGLLKPGMSGEATVQLAERRNVLRVPVSAVVTEERQPICIVKTASKYERRRVTLGLDNAVVVEIKDGLQEGEEVVLNPHVVRTRIVQKSGPPLPHLIIKSVRSTEETGQRRSFIAKYGLVAADLERCRSIPGVTGIIPVRLLPGDLRSFSSANNFTGRLVATTPEYAQLFRLEGRLLAGRFFTAEEERQLHNVVVLGAEAAEKLFPQQDAFGQTVVVEGKGKAFVVIGVLAPRPPVKGSYSEDFNTEVYIPFETGNKLLGATAFFRTKGGRGGEQVEVHAALVRGDREKLPGIAAVIREQLERFRPARDWEIGSVQ
jgi:hypothetical protein